LDQNSYGCKKKVQTSLIVMVTMLGLAVDFSCREIFFLFVTLLNRKVYERGIAIKQFLFRNDFDIGGYEEICN